MLSDVEERNTQMTAIPAALKTIRALKSIGARTRTYGGYQRTFNIGDARCNAEYSRESKGDYRVYCDNEDITDRLNAEWTEFVEREVVML
jgi:hypothetical protein